MMRYAKAHKKRLVITKSTMILAADCRVNYLTIPTLRSPPGKGRRTGEPVLDKCNMA
jgi:hypothetical protein